MEKRADFERYIEHQRYPANMWELIGPRPLRTSSQDLSTALVQEAIGSQLIDEGLVELLQTAIERYANGNKIGKDHVLNGIEQVTGHVWGESYSLLTTKHSSLRFDSAKKTVDESFYQTLAQALQDRGYNRLTNNEPVHQESIEKLSWVIQTALELEIPALNIGRNYKSIHLCNALSGLSSRTFDKGDLILLARWEPDLKTENNYNWGDHSGITHAKHFSYNLASVLLERGDFSLAQTDQIYENMQQLSQMETRPAHLPPEKRRNAFFDRYTSLGGEYPINGETVSVAKHLLIEAAGITETFYNRVESGMTNNGTLGYRATKEQIDQFAMNLVELPPNGSFMK